MKKRYKVLLLILLFVAVLFVSNNAFAAECIKGEREYVSCGTGANKATGIPAFLPPITSFLVALLQVAIPVVLIIAGILEMIKAIVAGNPDQVSKSKNKLIKKFVAALIAFFVITLLTTVVKMTAESNEKATFVACMSCFLNNDCNNDCSSYVSSNGEVTYKNECGQYTKDDCPASDDWGNTCSVVDNKCTISGHNNCSNYAVDECEENYGPSGFKCTLDGTGFCHESRTRKTCESYSKEECWGSHDAEGRPCGQNIDGSCFTKYCDGFDASTCPATSGIYKCKPAGNGCVADGYASCSSYTTETDCKGATDQNGKACSFVNGSCQATN